MSPEAEHVRKLAMQLDPAARWALAHDLLADAPPSPDHDADDDWSPTPEQRAEIDRRIRDVESGRSKLIPADHARRMIRGELDVPADD